MGGICSKRAVVDKSPSDITLNVDGMNDHCQVEPPIGETMEDEKLQGQSFAFSDPGVRKPKKQQLSRVHSERSTKSKTTTKVSEVSSLLGRASTAGFGKAVDVLDTLGSSMTGLGSGFVTSTAAKGNKISILAFEVANTIVKGASLISSLSKDSIKHLKFTVIPSEGVRHLISKDIDELLKIAANDKREELKIFSGEVVRFGNRCKDPQWHNLDRYFTRLETDLTPQRHLKEEALGVMEQMLVLVHCTAELYHEFHSLDKFEQDYKRKIREEENTNVTQRGENLQILKHELKTQRKHVANLKKKSLWSKSLEEVIEKLVDIVHFIHLEIHDAFGNAGGALTIKTPISHQRLGTAGLALHYANIITQIDTLVSRSGSVPSNTRDSLYQGLPPKIKSHLRSKLQSFHVKEELTVPQIKAEMEKTLQWLVPIANNTTKVHHGFGWVGEWANTGTQLNRNPSGSEIIRLETLYHANKDKTEAYILDLVVWLHHLISRSRPTNGAMQSPIKSPLHSPSLNSRSKDASAGNKSNGQTSILSQEDQNMIRNIRNWKHMTPGISKSQEFRTGNGRLYEDIKLSKSSSHSPMSSHAVKEIPSISRRSSAIIDFDIDRIKALDAIDRIDTLRNL